MDMNIQFTSNPYEGIDIISRGVTVDAKVAKLNNTTKRPVLVTNWEKGRPVIKISQEAVVEEKVENHDYDALLDKIGARAVDYKKATKSLGAKKLRVNKIVLEKTGKVYDAVKKENVEEEEIKQTLVNQINELTMPEESREEVHGKHEVPVKDIQEAIRQELTQQTPSVTTRVERNASNHELETKEEFPKEEVKATDMDLYNNLIHSSGVKDDDVSRQLREIREKISYEKAESKKLAEQYDRAIRECEELKNDIETKKRLKAQQEQRELAETTNEYETIRRANLEKTTNLSSIQAELARLKAEKEAMESAMYNDSQSFGRRAA